jgi:uracil-DNA glycosylase family 4
MAHESPVETDRETLRTELCNWLRLLEISGSTDLIIKSRHPVSTGGAARTGAPEHSGTATGFAPSPLSVEALMEEIDSCKRCDLYKTRTNTVFGEGNADARLMFIGEGPGRDEDIQGRPFVGRAGMLLTKIVEAMGLVRGDVYITNVVKCRPPGNRNPEIDEITACLPYLEKQIQLVAPDVICTLGLVASQTITGIRSGITAMRGRFCDYKGIPVMPTFHPAACLRKPQTKRLVWEDIKQIMKALDLPIRGVMRNGPGKDKR